MCSTAACLLTWATSAWAARATTPPPPPVPRARSFMVLAATTASPAAPPPTCWTAAQGIDTLTGGAGVDTLKGGAGDDTFVFASGQLFSGTALIDSIVGGDGTDTLRVSATSLGIQNTASFARASGWSRWPLKAPRAAEAQRPCSFVSTPTLLRQAFAPSPLQNSQEPFPQILMPARKPIPTSASPWSALQELTVSPAVPVPIP